METQTASGSVGSIAIRNEVRNEVRTVQVGYKGAMGQIESGQYDLAGKEIPPGIYHLEIVERLTLIRTHVESVSE